MKHKLLALALGLLPLPLFAGEVHDAICNGNLDRVKVLLRSAADINKLHDGNYPLSLASYCYGGSPHIVSYFLDRGANPNLHKDNDYPALMWAVRSMREGKDDPMRKIVFRLVRAGARADARNPQTGQTALMWAASHGDAELVDLLLSKGASKTARTEPGWCDSANTRCTAADMARLGGHVELALKLEGKDPTVYKRTLHYAVKQGDIARVRSLIKGGANVNEAEPLSKITPLHYAVAQGSTEIVRELLKSGANPNVMNFAGIAPLRDAVVKSRAELARLLIDAGAKANHEQTQGCGGGLTEFGWAIAYSQFDIARYMIEHSAVEPADPGKAFQEMYGRYEAEVPLVQLLLSKGAKPVEADIDALEKTEAANPWLKEQGTTRKIIGILQTALKQPVTPPSVEPDVQPDVQPEPAVENDPAVSVDDELPELPELGAMRSMGGAPRGYRTRSNRKPSPKAVQFDQRFRDARGLLRPDTMPGR